MMKQRAWMGLAAMLVLAGCAGGDDSGVQGGGPSMAALGGMLYRDSNLSEPAGQSCETCHSLVSGEGFVDPNSSNVAPVSEGAVVGEFGDRNAPTAAYALFSPDFQYDSVNKRYIGGQFLDGRARDLKEQAKGPFTNPKEMANADETAVIAKLRTAMYAGMFKQVFGNNSLDSGNEMTAFAQMAEAIAAFERTAPFAAFTSKFDAVQAGNESFTVEEQQGFDLFQVTGKGKCAECHKLEKRGGSSGVLFTDFSYWNIGVPKNPNNPVYAYDATFVDIGLAANPKLITAAAAERGKFKVPTLRNVALTAPYMHNGVFQTLEQVVDFYATRESRNCWSPTQIAFLDCWPDPEVPENVDAIFTGRLGVLPNGLDGLTQQEISDLVAFMNTLSDGYTP